MATKGGRGVDAFAGAGSLRMKKKEAKILRNVAVLFLPATVAADPVKSAKWFL